MSHVQNKSLISEFPLEQNSAGIYLLKVNNRNTRTRCEICSQLTIKTPENHLHLCVQKLNLEISTHAPESKNLHQVLISSH